MLSLFNQVSCCLFLKKVDTIIRRLRLLERAKRYWNAAGSGTREALLELRAAPYPYSKMCNALRAVSLWNHLEQPQASGTREALMELRAAPYPYSKMCNVCNVCNAS